MKLIEKLTKGNLENYIKIYENYIKDLFDAYDYENNYDFTFSSLETMEEEKNQMDNEVYSFLDTLAHQKIRDIEKKLGKLNVLIRVIGTEENISTEEDLNYSKFIDSVNKIFTDAKNNFSSLDEKLLINSEKILDDLIINFSEKTMNTVTLNDFYNKYINELAEINKDIEKNIQVKETIEKIQNQARAADKYIKTKKENEASDYFERREKELRGNSNRWIERLWILLGVWFIMSILIAFLGKTLEITSWKDYLLKCLPLSTLFIAFTTYIITQYTKERNLEEAYKFKSVQLLTLEKHLDYYKIGGSHEEEEICNKAKLDFLSETLNKIHTSPMAEGNKTQIKTKNALDTANKVINLLNKSGVKVSISDSKEAS